jgi:hypothetical protein
MGAPAVAADMLESRSIKISLSHIKYFIDLIGILSLIQEGKWLYEPPADIDPKDVLTLSLGLDGTCMYLGLCEGWKEALVATITAYNKEEDRLHTIYIGSAPEAGKEKFLALVTEEWEKARKRYPNAVTQGLADGAPWIWAYLTEKTEHQVLDFYHMSDYVGLSTTGLFNPSQEDEIKSFKETWLSQSSITSLVFISLLSCLRTSSVVSAKI